MDSKRSVRYKIGKHLGSGTFGFVFEGVETATKRSVAWKRSVKASRVLSRELEILEAVRNGPHLVTFVEIFYSLNEDNRLVQNIILPLYEADMERVLRLRLRSQHTLNYVGTKKMIYQLVLGLVSLHAQGICHRDMKPENVLYKDGQVSISDFGCSKRLGAFNSPYSVSRYYRSPELFLGAVDYTCSVDTWSIGVMFWEFCFGELPFRGKSEGRHLIEILKFCGQPTDQQWKDFRRGGGKWKPDFNLLKQVGGVGKFREQVETLTVPAAEKASLMSFLRDCFDYSYKTRIFGRQLERHPFFDDVREADLRLDIKL